MSSVSTMFPSTFRRSTYELIPITVESVCKYVEDNIDKQIESAKKNKLPMVVVHVIFPKNWKYDYSTTIIPDLISEMVTRFEPIEIPWGFNEWRTIRSTDLVQINGLNFVTEFRFTLHFIKP
jgi:hypothetical protein